MAWNQQKKNVTLITAILSIYVLDFAINAGQSRPIRCPCDMLILCSRSMLS